VSEERRHDDPGGRSAWFHRSRGGRRGLPAEAFVRAATARREATFTATAAPAAPAAPGVPGAAANWIPLGPFAITGGQASGHPVVSGRVEAIAAGPGGTRVYIGAADGGAWFSPDAGATWEVLDDFATTAPGSPARVANSLSVGALAVAFGADRAADQVFVGTGEYRAGYRGLFGVGVKVSTAGGTLGSWTLEATNLAGLGCTKLVIDPDTPALVVVATTAGLFTRPAAPAARAAWTQVVSPAFTSSAGVVSDVLIAGTGVGKTYYAAFENDGVYSSPDLVTWTRVPGGAPAAGDGRIVLGASEVTPAVVYAFCQSRRLLRLTAGSFVAVAGVPVNVFGTRGSGGYDIILAVDPGAADTVYLGGSIAWDLAPGDPVADWTLALFRGTVTNPAVAPVFPFNPANNGPGTSGALRESTDATFVGRGIHPDAQSVAFSRRADNSGLDGTGVWIGCDGGIFHSPGSGALGTFTSRGAGLATAQLTYLAAHPSLEAVALAGCQDNGTIRWTSGPAWHEALVADGGGVAIDQNTPYRMMRQYVRATLWRTITGGATAAAWSAVLFPPRTANTAAQSTAAATEDSRASSDFYSPIATTPAGVAPTLVAKGTNRVWLSSNWGTSWVTLPTGTNPYTPAAPNLAQDSLGGPVRGLAFPSAVMLFAATATTVTRFDFAAGAWAATTLPAIPGLAAATPLTAIATAGGATLYATVGGVGVDHCWYWDGAAWHATGLMLVPGGGPGTPQVVDVPASCVTIDPANPATVFCGTDIGVFRSVRAGVAHAAWTLFSTGLPESAVMDLQVHTPSRTLRAATHGRGVWEFPLGGGSPPHPELFLRMNVGDHGRRLAGADGGGHPDTPGSVLGRAVSPDIRVRRGVAAAAPPPFPGRQLRQVRPVRLKGDDIRTWQQGVLDRGFAIGVDGTYGPESDRVCRAFQARFGLVVDGIVGPITWPATFAYPRLVDATSALAVELGTVDDVDPVSGATRADSAGTNRIFVEVHSRSVHPVDPGGIVVCLLFADDAGGVNPALPAGYAARIRSRDTTGWLGGSGWVFANPGAPYAPIPRPLSASTPQVVEYLVDFSAVALPSKTVLALALVSTADGSDPLASAETAPLTLVRNERRTGAKRLLLVP
jgi:putative peptidoglycan binding protein